MSDEENETGLYEKYDVYKNGERQTGCFVLKPARDEAARHALRAYATQTDNEQLADDIREMLRRLRGLDETKRRYSNE